MSRFLNTQSNNINNQRVFWRDPIFALVLAAGPVVWLLCWLAGLPRVSTAPNWWMYIRLVMVAPVLEEVVFRGGLQTLLLERSTLARQRYYNLSLANVIASIAFAAAHLFNQSPLWAALVFIPSLVFGWARDRFESVLPSIVLHSTYNAGFVWLFVNTQQL